MRPAGSTAGAGMAFAAVLVALGAAPLFAADSALLPISLVSAGIILCVFIGAVHLMREGRGRRSIEADAAEWRKGQAEAEAAHLAATRALAITAHEIRTPMAGIIGMLRLLLDTELTPEQRNYARTAVASASALMSIADELLDAPVPRGAGAGADDGFDPAALAESVTELLAPRAHAKGLEISCFVSGQLPGALAGDERRLRQVLLNLCGNALKFTEAGGVALELHRLGENKLRIAVSDTGIGMTEEEQQRIFEERVQANGDTQRLFGGSGMGLAICRKLLDAMGGEISVRSAPGAGSVFEVILPLDARARQAPETRPCEAAYVLAAPPSIAAHHLQLMLEERGARIRRISRAEDFAAALEGDRPALEGDLICDEAYAGLLRRRIQQAGGLPLRRVVLSVRSEERRHFEDILALPGADVLLKPVRRTSLQRLITRENDTNITASVQRLRDIATAVGRPHQLSVILAEDDPANALLARTILERAGCQVRHARTGQEALDLLQRGGKADLIIMDVEMPVLDGLETTRIIRRGEAEASRPRVPILALTAGARDANLALCLTAGMDGFLPKPFDRHDLEEALAGLAARRTAA